MRVIDRREFLKALAAAGACAAAGARAENTVTRRASPRTRSASASPRAIRCPMAWCCGRGSRLRLTRTVGGMGRAIVPVRWEIATDELMRDVVASGSAEAAPEWGHSVHVEPQGLEPDRAYWYRFTRGRRRKARSGARAPRPPPDAAPARLRFAFASCQQYEQGYYGAYRHIVADDPDLIVFLGDYIYESSWGRNHVRKHTGGEPYTLEDYRARYALYKSDPDLQAAHRACPWIVTWDDHEVDNDYAERPARGRHAGRALPRAPRRRLPRLLRAHAAARAHAPGRRPA